MFPGSIVAFDSVNDFVACFGDSPIDFNYIQDDLDACDSLIMQLTRAIAAGTSDIAISNTTLLNINIQTNRSKQSKRQTYISLKLKKEEEQLYSKTPIMITTIFRLERFFSRVFLA